VEEINWDLAFRVLGDLLSANNGCVGTKTLKKELERRGVTEASDHVEELVEELKYFDPDSSRERGLPTPGFRFFHLNRSFYSEERYDQEIRERDERTRRDAEKAANRDAEVAGPEETPISRTNRQEEARMGQYVKNALEELYSNELAPEERTYVFDVHSVRPGGTFENVDLLAIHWQPRDICELITVEVKLEFNAQVVHQALNYTRFSHRTWIAVPVETGARSELWERNPGLFDYAISHGLGILACHRRQGGRWDVSPVHWPIRHQPNLLEEEEFLERYRDTFEEAGIIDSRNNRRRPRLR
jgi:hypothetical protein